MNAPTKPKPAQTVENVLDELDRERTVYVVAGGDFPDSVFSTEEKAEAYVAHQRREDERNQRRIYWRVYEYKIDGAAL